MTEPPPPTRWELAGDSRESGYVRTFLEQHEAGSGDDGEARLADVLAPRGARVLDAGSGVGRVAEALRRRGHDVTAVEKDAALVAISRERFPDVGVVEADLLALTPELLTTHGRPSAYDVVVVVGNVMVFLADDTQVEVLRVLAGLLAEDGCLLVGFHPVAGPTGSRDYPAAELREHAEEAGLRLDLLAGSYDLRPPGEDYVVAVLRAQRPAPDAR
ncbi:class I SAM-dependent methyltransferase [Nocardioides aurantiacus]|uniref:Methyltransferase family protein n=1 Tax=Nocardioides aurantiacus TaxID=86796 RepID=A0A3N2CQB7_9ACTN|nr:methyltransferase domain-containing protein [Nocardioides aurantiacus]ROR89679.1 methyltransferase family protein [Nocardioides aurantiacus]